ncbi:MAG: DUF547 domain-containing protein [Aquisalinus sp.]|nr:DUF547 domain-containing protein [Aquisalinus sp.]
MNTTLNTTTKLKTALAGMIASVALLATPALAGPEAFSQYSGDQTEAVDHAAWGTFLGKYLKTAETGPNLVAYGQVSAEDKQALKDYIDSLEAIDPTRLSEDEAFAYWVNLYNSVTIEVILDNYPVDSIRDIRSGVFAAGPWKMDLVQVNGEDLSLDNIEHDILREYFNEPRVHYAVNCASIGCPNLVAEPYTGETLEAQLEAGAIRYVNDPRGVSFDDDGDVTLSSIYKWFKEDFGTSQTQVLAHVRRYADDDLRAKLANVSRIDGYKYDWALNETQ